MQAYFLALNVVTVATLGTPSWSAVQAVVLVGCLAAGAVVGARLAGAVPLRAARTLTLVLAAAGGTGVLISAAVG